MNKKAFFSGIAIGLVGIIAVGTIGAVTKGFREWKNPFKKKPQLELSEYVELETAPGLGFMLLENDTYSVFATETGLTEVSVPEMVDGVKVTEVASMAFMSNCTTLTKVTLPDSIEVIGESAFADCDELTEINLPKELKRVEACAFQSIPSDFRLPEKLEYIGSNAFNATSITEVVFPKTLKTVESSAFSGCTALTKVNMGSVENVVTGAFSKCTALTSVTLSGNLKDIPVGLFDGARALETLDLPEGIKTIGSMAFARSGLKKITIPDSVVVIYSSAFASCAALTEITLGKNVKHIGAQAFANCTTLTTVYNLSGLTLTKGDAEGHGGIAANATNIYTELPAA